MIRRQTKPGVHGKKKRRNLSEYGKLLVMKQKIKLSYGIREKQFKKYYEESAKHKGLTSALLLQKLESRLDNVVYRLGFSSSRISARQYINHGHFLINGRRVISPSCQVKVNNLITINPFKKEKGIFKNIKTALKKYKPPAWLSFDVEKLEGKVVSLPSPEQIQSPFDFNAVIEYYSK